MERGSPGWNDGKAWSGSGSAAAGEAATPSPGRLRRLDLSLRDRREPENAGEVAAPPGADRDLADRGAVMGVDHRLGRARDRAVLRRQVRPEAKEKHVA